MLAIAGVGLLAVGVMVLLNAGAEPPGRLATVGLRALCGQRPPATQQSLRSVSSCRGQMRFPSGRSRSLLSMAP
jgi:hypothetical protein